MKKINKLINVLAFTALFAATPMFAQGTPVNSNGYFATAETIKTDIDKFLDVRYFNDVSFEKVFVNTNFTDNNFNLGVAGKIKDFYLATYYSGDFWNNISGEYTNESINTINDDINDNIYDYTNITLNKDNVITNKNGPYEASFLVGLPNKMGIKLDTNLDMNSVVMKNNTKDLYKGENESTEDIFDPNNRDDYTPTKSNSNNAKINLYWSCFDIAVNKTNIKPWASIGFNLIDNSKEWEEKNLIKKVYEKEPYNNIDTVSTYNKQQDSYMNPTLNLDLAADFTFKHNDKSKSLLVIDYRLSNTFYSNKPTLVEKSSLVDNLNPKKNWSEETTTNITDRIDVVNRLNTSYRFEIKPIEKLTVVAGFDINSSVKYRTSGNTITTTTENKDGINTVTTTKNEKIESIFKDGVLVDQGNPYISRDNSYKIITTKLEPQFKIGASYAVKPNFVINLGYWGGLPYLTVENNNSTIKTTTTTYDFTNPLKPEVSNVETKNDSEKIVNSSTDGYGSDLTAGFTWIMSDCCILDVGLSISHTPSLEEVWKAGWDLGFTFKK